MPKPQASRDGAPTPSLLRSIVNKTQVNPGACEKTQSQPFLARPSPGHIGMRVGLDTVSPRGTSVLCPLVRQGGFKAELGET